MRMQGLNKDDMSSTCRDSWRSKLLVSRNKANDIRHIPCGRNVSAWDIMPFAWPKACRRVLLELEERVEEGVWVKKETGVDERSGIVVASLITESRGSFERDGE